MMPPSHYTKSLIASKRAMSTIAVVAVINYAEYADRLRNDIRLTQVKKQDLDGH
jgi:hypothetical protein